MTRRHILAAAIASMVLGGAATAADDTPAADPAALATATFAGGCFWCMEHPYDSLDGVVSTTSGYAGGETESPTYEEVSSGGTGHTEVVQIVYDPATVSYGELLRIFWRNVDPLDAGGQFCDRGSQYRTAIFYETDEQRKLAEASKQELDQSGRFDSPIVTEIVAASAFYPAEDYHQDYYLRNPLRYRYYRYACGRDHTLEERWGAEAGGKSS